MLYGVIRDVCIFPAFTRNLNSFHPADVAFLFLGAGFGCSGFSGLGFGGLGF